MIPYIFFIFLFILIMLGGIFLLIGLLLLKNCRKKDVLCTQKAAAVVIDNIRRKYKTTGETPRFSWYPVIRYTAAGQVVEKAMSTGHAQGPKYSIGTELRILYQPDKPENCLIENDSTQKLVSTVFICVGCGLLLTGLILACAFFLLF